MIAARRSNRSSSTTHPRLVPEFFPLLAKAVSELNDLHRQLGALCSRYVQLVSFESELARATKRKPFLVRNEMLWEVLIRSHLMLVLDVSEWIGCLCGWLPRSLQGQALQELRTSKTKARRDAVGALKQATPADLAFWERHHQESYASALRLLFGGKVERARSAGMKDVASLVRRLERWRAPLREMRNSVAHPYGKKSLVGHNLRQLRPRLERGAKVLNALSLLLDCSTHHYAALEPKPECREARDLVDLLVLGSISESTERTRARKGPYYWQRRDQEYARLHRKHRASKSPNFNVDDEHGPTS